MTNQNIQTDAATAQPGTTEPPRRVGSPASDELEFRAAGRNYHHANAEVALLSAMLNESRRIRRICRALGTEEFYDWQTRDVLHAILFLDNSGREVTPQMLLALSKPSPGLSMRMGSVSSTSAHTLPTTRNILKFISHDLKEATRVCGGDGIVRRGSRNLFVSISSYSGSRRSNAFATSGILANWEFWNGQEPLPPHSS